MIYSTSCQEGRFFHKMPWWKASSHQEAPQVQRAHAAEHTGWPPASGMASIPPSWHLHYRLLGIIFCDRKAKFPVLLSFVHPSEHIHILLFPDQPAVSSGHTGTICSEGSSFTPWCKPQPLIHTSSILSHKQTQMCSQSGGFSLAGPFSSMFLAGCSIIRWFLSVLSLHGLSGLAPAWTPVQEARMGLQSLLAEDIWVLLLLTEGEKGLPDTPILPDLCWRQACRSGLTHGEEGMDGWCLAFADFVSPEPCHKRAQMGLLLLTCMLGGTEGGADFGAEWTKRFGALSSWL